MVLRRPKVPTRGDRAYASCTVDTTMSKAGSFRVSILSKIRDRRSCKYNTLLVPVVRHFASSQLTPISTGNTKFLQSLEKLALKLEDETLLDESRFVIGVDSPRGCVGG